MNKQFCVVNESSAVQLFLMGKFTLIYECFGLQARSQNGLCSQSKVLLYDICHYCEYSEKLLMMDRGTVRNMQFYSKNKFEKLVHLVGFIIRIRFITLNLRRTEPSLTSRPCLSYYAFLQSPKVHSVHRTAYIQKWRRVSS